MAEDVLVPYGRFLEHLERRRRVKTDLDERYSPPAETPSAPATGQPVDDAHRPTEDVHPPARV